MTTTHLSTQIMLYIKREKDDKTGLRIRRSCKELPVLWGERIPLLGSTLSLHLSPCFHSSLAPSNVPNAGAKSPYQLSAFPGGNDTLYHQLIRRGHMAWQHSVQRRWRSKWGQMWVNFTHPVTEVVELCYSAIAKEEVTPSVQFLQTIFLPASVEIFHLWR